eukprot:TRINITY_DN19369_c0_g1_i1.p2 TRINITY_DN19369_c0_g1~~TRINITY_DN19369_c0_g1_i1.p2  ORF type:complete len:169 (+),score=42.18 TRINITY_DN19369_c0_g1_i1:59-565(+)
MWNSLTTCKSPLAFSTWQFCARSYVTDARKVLGDFRVPRSKVVLTHARSSGPGGQNVNKLNTKAEIRFKVDEATWIPEDVRKRFKAAQVSRITREGEFVTSSQRHRTQLANTDDCFDKLEEMIAEVWEPPKERIETEVPEHAIQERKKLKQAQSRKKDDRRYRGGDSW